MLLNEKSSEQSQDLVDQVPIEPPTTEQPQQTKQAEQEKAKEECAQYQLGPARQTKQVITA